MTDWETMRHNMVDSQLRPVGVRDLRILNAMWEIPREVFVPASLRAVAYADIPLKVADGGKGPGRYLLPPATLARLVQLAEVESGDLVLDVGCTTGYSTAVLARLAESVVALEEDEELAEQANRNLSELAIDNTAVVTGPLVEGYGSEGPYDVIFLNGTIMFLPEALKEQLKPGGRLVAIWRDEGVGRGCLWRKTEGEAPVCHPAFDATAPMLPGFEATPAFAF